MLVTTRQLLLLLGASVLAGFLAPILVSAFVGPLEPTYWAYLIADFTFLLLLAAGLFKLSVSQQVDPERLIGLRPQRTALVRSAAPAIPLLLLSFGTMYAVLLPLSYLAPELVEWLLWDLPLVFRHRGEVALFPTILQWLSVIALAPAVEEIFFRGFLFRRLEVKFGFTIGAFGSSTLFALPHLTDPLGAFLFGLAAVVLYVRWRTLWVPFVVHATYNLLICVLTAWSELTSETVVDGSAVSEFQTWWLGGAVGLALGGLWFVRFMRQNWPTARNPC